jgi:hypothetical protein
VRLPFLIGAIVALLVFVAPGRRGPALLPDSLSYLGTAQSIARTGRPDLPAADWSDADSTSTLSQFPPLYPVVLALPIAVGARAVALPRWTNALAAGLTAGTLAALGLAAAGSLGAVLVPLLVFATPAIGDVHLLAASEPLFLALLSLTLLAMVRDRRLAAGVLAALAALTRYAGAAVVGAVVVWAALRARGWRNRLIAVAAAALPGVATQVAWRVWLARQGATVPGRAPVPYPGTLGTMANGADAFAAWLAPVSTSGARIALGGAVLLLIVWLAYRMLTSPDAAVARRVLGAASVLGLAYAVLLVYARRWVGGEIHFDGRILSPLMLLGATIAGVTLARAWTGLSRGSRIASAVLLSAWIVRSAETEIADVRLQRATGRGYEQNSFQESPLAAWLRGDGARYALFTDNPAAAWFVAPRPSRQLPASLAADSVRAFGDTLRARGGALVGFDGPIGAMASGDSLAARLGMVVAARSRYGTAWVPACRAPHCR